MSNSHIFDVDDAVKYGFKEAVILGNIKFWIAKNKALLLNSSL
jgi:hypothetical protein